MASRGKKKTTIAKFAREARQRERRMEKEMRKEERKLAASQDDSPGGTIAPGTGHAAERLAQHTQ
jgi:hypothetical protein